MPEVAPDFTKATAGTPMLPKGEYRFKVGKPTGKIGQDKNGQITKVVIYPLQVLESKGAEGEAFVGKYAAPQRCSIHDCNLPHLSEGFFRDMTKAFLLAGAGYTLREEDKANEEFFSQADFQFEESGEGEGAAALGDGWSQVTGNEVWATADTDKTGEFQNYRAWAPARE